MMKKFGKIYLNKSYSPLKCSYSMNNTSTMTFRYALSVLEKEFDATYRGIKTVREMCDSLTDAISWENESPDAVYHQFETKVGPNTIIREDQVIKLAQHYA